MCTVEPIDRSTAVVAELLKEKEENKPSVKLNNTTYSG